FADLGSSRKLAGNARKLITELAGQALRTQLISSLKGRQFDAAGLLAFRQEVRALVNGRFARMWGISPNALSEISADLEELINDMVRPGLNSSKSVQTTALKKFLEKLDKLGVFSADTAAGQAMRGFATTLAFVGMAFSLKKAI